MKKLLNTLYVTKPDAYLRLDGETVVIEISENKVGQVPLHNLSAIVCFGYRGVSPALMGVCASKGIELCFLSPNGRFLARINGPVHGNVLLREKQFSVASDANASLEAAKMFICAKIYNCRWSIERTMRDHAMRIDTNNFENAITTHKDCLKAITFVKDIEELMGLEGVAAKAYFSVFDQMILRNKDAFNFSERNRRPPLDRVNALLSFTYTLLMNDICGALESVGLDPYVGFLHSKRPGRVSLALDMLEEFRAVIADRFVLKQINLGSINANDFNIKENGAVTLTDDAKRNYISAWQEHKHKDITHPFLKEKVQWGIVPYAQSLLMSRWLRNDLDTYPPFFWK